MLGSNRAAALLTRALQSQQRHLNVHEYVGKDLMKKYGVDHQRGAVVTEVSQIASVFENTPTDLCVVKAQILAGGRGKGVFNTGFKGGVKLAKTAAEAEGYAKEMLGNILVTKQNGAGQPVNQLFVAECLDIQKEYYFAMMLQGAFGGPVMLGSHRGGMDIETVAKENPEDIHTQPIDIKTGLTQEMALAFATKIGFEGEYVAPAADAMIKLYKTMTECDGTMIEINPLAETPDGRVVCIDAKFNFDDSAGERQAKLFALRDTTQEDEKEVQAEKYGLNYIALDGNIACLVNGAGLAMATMDIIHQNGGEPANFLDVGGGATKEAVTAAFKIITSDPKVTGILVNIFGGIMRCDTIANGIVAAAKEVDIKVPVVCRLAGTNQELGQKILKDSGLDEKLIAAADLDDAARKITKLCPKE
eukprot:NODE_662_length_1452_cov_121.795438_g496_i0.p2 GENE.NODE_662_length_1452_cov_121.795438_g496_i0~~NODE_662_length_1452_cov_121.795438_g496_i0.p2  ORF type:complete len:418 (-),score=168.20 NODE_662_length_1452_cov_121.795438_g496_i0:137-1390(-)